MELKGFVCTDSTVNEFLEKIPPALREAGQLITAPAGHVMVRQEESVRYAWFLLSGELVTFSETEEGKKSSFICWTARPLPASPTRRCWNLPERTGKMRCFASSERKSPCWIGGTRDGSGR